MVQAKKSRLFSAAVICFTMFGMLASPVAAQLVIQDTAVVEPGIDATGMPDPALGGNGVRRVFKYTRIRVLVAVIRGRVTNLSGRPAVFPDFNLDIPDPVTGVNTPAVRDVYVYSRHAGVDACRLVAVGWRPE